MTNNKKQRPKNHIWGWALGLFFLGCAIEDAEELPQYDPTSGESYYTWLYKDSAFLECPGDPMRPWIDPVSMLQYTPIYNRMARHLGWDDTLTWDFTAKEIKVTPHIYDYIIPCGSMTTNSCGAAGSR